jgi:hypothetical protein
MPFFPLPLWPLGHARGHPEESRRVGEGRVRGEKRRTTNVEQGTAERRRERQNDRSRRAGIVPSSFCGSAFLVHHLSFPSLSPYPLSFGPPVESLSTGGPDTTLRRPTAPVNHRNADTSGPGRGRGLWPWLLALLCQLRPSTGKRMRGGHSWPPRGGQECPPRYPLSGCHRLLATRCGSPSLFFPLSGCHRLLANRCGEG